MEEILNGIKAYIIATASFYTEQADEQTPMNALTESDIIIGQVDLTKQKSKILCSLIPDTQEPEDAYIEGTSANNNITVTFICRGAKIDVLIRQMMRYAEAFKNASFEDNSMGGICGDITIESIKYYLDAGIIDNQATAVEITIQVNKPI